MPQWILSKARDMALTVMQTVKLHCAHDASIRPIVEIARDGLCALHGFLRRNVHPTGVGLTFAVLFWVVFLIIAPQLFMLDISIRTNLPRSQVGGPLDVHTLANYRSFFLEDEGSGRNWNITQLVTFCRTIASSIQVMLAAFVISYPVAFYLAQVASARSVRLMLLLLLLPYWVNEVLRAYAFEIIFSDEGFLNRLFMASGLVSMPIDFLNRNVALYTGLVYAYLLFMFFPIYSSLQSISRAQIEAARDLGAPWWHIHLFVVFPGARAGIASGCTLVFMMCAGSLVIPQVLGGTRSLWFTPIVYDRFFESFDWPQGAAYATLLVLACTGLVALARLFFRWSGRRTAE